MNASHALPLGLARAAVAGIALATTAPAHADNYIELVALRADIGAGFTPLLFTVEMVLDDLSVTGAIATDPNGNAIEMDGAGDGTWDAILGFADVSELIAGTHGSWSIEIQGPAPSTSIFTFDATGYVDADIPPVATDVFPGFDEGCIDPDFTATWTDPTGGTADGVAVSFCNVVGCFDDDSVFGTMKSTDTSWVPPVTPEDGPSSFELDYINFDDNDRASALEVVSGSITWGISPFAPPGHPAATPLVLNGSSVFVTFSVGTPGPNVLLWLGRANIGGDPGTQYLGGAQVSLPGIPGVTGVRLTTPTDIQIDLVTDDGVTWDMDDAYFDSFASMVAATQGSWFVEVSGSSPSLSTFFLVTSLFSSGEFYAPPTIVAPVHGSTADPAVQFQWTDPTGGDPHDVIAVYADGPTQSQDAWSLDGTLDLAATAWMPDEALETGPHDWGIAYAKFDRSFRVSPLKVISGTIAWSSHCSAPFGTPPGTPLLLYGGEAMASFTVLEGAGGGSSFDPPVEIGAITEASALGVADFDGVHGNDIIVPIAADVPTDPGVVAVFLNDGTGVAYERVDTTVGVLPAGATHGDFDGVNGPDAAVANAGDDTVTILLNDGAGAGTFITAQVIPVGTTPTGIDAGDADGDADIDLIVTNFGDGTAQLLRNANGTFTAEAPFAVGDGPRGVAFATFASIPAPGGAIDFAVALETAGEVAVFVNDGAGGFSEGARAGVVGAPITVDPEDLDHDKDRDIVVGACDTDVVTVLSGDGAGGFQTLPFTVGECPSDLDLADLDGDGDTDIVVVRDSPSAPGERGALILDNRLEGGGLDFVPDGEAAVEPGLDFVLAALLDGDERVDLVATASVGGTGSVFVVPNTTETAAGDVNGDGLVDVTDLLAVLSSWGPCADPPITCPEDLDGDGQVGVTDLLEVLGNWN